MSALRARVFLVIALPVAFAAVPARAQQSVSRPSLMVTQAQLPALREKAKTTHKLQYKLAMVCASNRLNAQLTGEAERREMKNPEQAWMDFRTGSTTLFPLAFGQMMTGEQKYADAVRRWVMGYVAYSEWGPRYDTGVIDIDLYASMPLAAVAVAYDWCHDIFTDAERAQIRKAMLKQCRLFVAQSTGKAVEGYQYPWWYNHEFQNHAWVNYGGLGLAALAMLDEEPEAKELLAPALKFYRTLFQRVGPDGSWHEGVGYWAFAWDYGMMFAEALRTRTGESIFKGEFPANTALWRIYMDVPDFERNCLQFDDAPYDHGGWMAPYYIMRALGAQYKDGYAYALADKEEAAINARRNGDGHSFAPLAFLWYDESVKPKALSELPRRKLFADGGFAIMRSGWDDDATVMGLRCAPQGGRTLVNTGQMQYRYSIGHTHADANAFNLFARGDFLAIDAGLYGYPATEFHNSMLFDDVGQSRYYGNWRLFQKRCGKILDFKTGDGYGYVLGEAAQAYPVELGLKKFQRHLVSLDEKAFVILDDVQLDKPRRPEFLLNTPSMPRVAEDGRIVAEGKDGAKLIATVLAPAQFARRTRKYSSWGQVRISPAERTDAAVFLTVLQPVGASERPATVRKLAADGWLGARITIGGKDLYAAFRKTDAGYAFVPEGFPAEILEKALAAEPAPPKAVDFPGRVLVELSLSGFEQLGEAFKPLEAKEPPSGKVSLDTSAPAEGKGALKIEYNLKPGSGNGVQCSIPLPGKPRKFSVAVREPLEAPSRQVWFILDSADWQRGYGKMMFDSPGDKWSRQDVPLGIDSGATLWTLTKIEVVGGQDKMHGIVTLDDLRLVTSIEAGQVEALRKDHPDLKVLGPDEPKGR